METTLYDSPEEKIKCAILRILNLSSLRLFGCLIYNFRINCIDTKKALDNIIINSNNQPIDIQKHISHIKNILEQRLTANISIRNGFPTIDIYSSFIENHTVPELTFVLLHEIIHFISGDCMYKDGVNEVAINLAQDHNINQSLKKDIANKILDSEKICLPNDHFLIPELEDENLTKIEVYDWLLQNINNDKSVEISIPIPIPNTNSNKKNQNNSEENSDSENNIDINKNEDIEEVGKEEADIEEVGKEEADIEEAGEEIGEEEAGEGDTGGGEEEADIEEAGEGDTGGGEGEGKGEGDTGEGKDSKSPEKLNPDNSINDNADEDIDEDIIAGSDIDEDDSLNSIEVEEIIKVVMSSVKIEGREVQTLSDVTTSQTLETKLITEQIRSETRATIENILPSQRGNTSGSVFEMIKKMVEVTVPWDKLLDRAICSKILPDEDSRTWTQLRKRPMSLGLLLPGTSIEEIPCYLVIVCDTSGSINTSDLQQFSSVILQSAKYFDVIRVIKHDTKITSDKIIESQYIVSDDIVFKFEGRGGTSHIQVFNKIKEMYEDDNLEISLIIMLTDFYSDIERIWNNFEWVKQIPVCICLTSNVKPSTVPEYIDKNPIIIKDSSK